MVQRDGDTWELEQESPHVETVVLGEPQQVVQLGGDTWEWPVTQQLEVHAYHQEQRPTQDARCDEYASCWVGSTRWVNGQICVQCKQMCAVVEAEVLEDAAARCKHHKSHW